MNGTDWHVEFYKARRGEIQFRLDQEQRLINYSLLALGGFSAFFASALDYIGGWVCPVSFSAALFFLTLIILFLRHDLFIAYNAQYEVRLLAETEVPEDALSWEGYVSRKRGTEKRSFSGIMNRTFHAFLALIRFSPMLIATFGFFGLGCYTRFSQAGQLSPSGWLVSLSTGLFGIWWAGFALCIVTAIMVWHEEGLLRAITENARQL